MNKYVYWAPRILTIAFILFLGLFALDAFEGDETFIKKAGNFIVHLSPNFLMILILFVAWEHEWIGTIAFTIFGIAYILIAWGKFPLTTYLIISGPLFLIGILFWINWLERKKIEKKRFGIR